MVPDIKDWKKWWSMRFIILTTIFSSASVTYMALPARWADKVPDWAIMVLTGGSLVTGIAAGVARVVHQKNLDGVRQLP